MIWNEHTGEYRWETDIGNRMFTPEGCGPPADMCTLYCVRGSEFKLARPRGAGRLLISALCLYRVRGSKFKLARRRGAGRLLICAICLYRVRESEFKLARRRGAGRLLMCGPVKPYKCLQSVCITYGSLN